MILLENKPLGISSAAFAAQLGRKMGHKFGYLGTLDPFARGAMLLACKKHAKLFRFLRTEPKVYSATIWFGASSPSLDDENIKLNYERSIGADEFCEALNLLQGQITYTPPAFSAKKINGTRAYTLARRGENVTLKSCTMYVRSEFISMCWPFASFRLFASKGTYVRSYAQLVCKQLGVKGTLASLRRESEGDFAKLGTYDAFSSVALSAARYLGDMRDILQGKKLLAKDICVVEQIDDSVDENCVKIDLGERFCILRLLDDGSCKYELNLVEK